LNEISDFGGEELVGGHITGTNNCLMFAKLAKSAIDENWPVKMESDGIK